MNTFLYIILIHFLADFALQTNEQAQNKSAGMNFYNLALFRHVLTYSFVWLIAILIISTPGDAIRFSIITFLLHYVTDWFTSRMSKPLFDDKDYHTGFVVIGADQVCHYVQLYYTFMLFGLL